MQAVAANEAGPEARFERFRCGTLLYTKAGLFTLFSWLLWGDFCFTLMEQIWPNILPLMLKAQGAPNIAMSIIVTVIPSAMNFVLNPIISTASDRYRSRRGRRIPFLLFATPCVTFFLILLGFSRQLGEALHTLLAGAFPGWQQAGVTVGLIGLLVVGFRFFELFVNTVFWYLFNDVVPVAFMGRFLAFFRIAGSLAGAFFNFFLLRYAQTHTSEIFLGVALLYGTMFFLMCLNVKEGQYPEPEAISGTNGNAISAVKGFFRECFTARIYRLVFTYNAFYLTGAAVNTFMVFAAFSIGLNLEEVGQVAGGALIMTILLMYPMGALVDRYNPLRVMIVAQIGMGLAYAVKLVFLFHEFEKSQAFLIYAIAAGLAVPMNAANLAASMPMLMRVFPKERFGQFCAANAMCGAVGTVVGGFLAGALLDQVRLHFTASGDFYYRIVPAWSMLFAAATAVATYLVYREWLTLGGSKGYVPPGRPRENLNDV